MLKKSNLVLWGVVLFVAWNALILFFLWTRPQSSSDHSRLTEEVIRLAQDAEVELEHQKELLHQIYRYSALWNRRKATEAKRLHLSVASSALPSTAAPLSRRSQISPDAVLPVLVIACDRSTVRRCLDKLLHYRPSKERFPIIVSQDCGHEETARVIASYGDAIMHIKQPNLSDIPVPTDHRKFQGYYKIARHYRWALSQVFRNFKYQAAIVVEDDLEVAPDFFEYFQAAFPLLLADPTLWCLSAWNDNGKEQMVDANHPELLYRTDFFPGLGWLLLSDLWDELEPKWPKAFWDDWMRHPEQRQGRSCIRPEVSRTMTFGRKGVSHGQFFDQYLKFIKLNDRFVPFTQMDLSYLKKDEYERSFLAQVYGAPELRVEELQGNQRRELGTVRVQYTTRDSFKAFAKALGVMDDLKSGVPRAGYQGIVSFLFRGRRVYLAPPSDWTGYDPSWS
ncbi:alpha-1,3-mannosyl-glycoprotein 2-beta-N-acetylglucosaminyltransferase [Zootoca vivipara]|uniref:alpha-1,3-mannosyl-glycoprotein 2-beta-N-acetylglucosaminyltransferase n=1 Tax=Zootoca vivipara TaxID=8524 RepID=UPI00293B9B0B|nr:alpha-1,3-mannosyl-glycoprotein 2-beta-N-acetylglucosaminyltransferase [Zootoca vivipara]XP_034962897.2 alpha-1,3-mannosyl-glycoprotein 2-beta-N-acetylglucosaminyltransferase [Zootoca vivipara]XP_034962900.2 alpha-1,3-mannosyl-glycoprotein 2-beta-N-acetylglucosaminyltransferase [Zootoca vivipara]XP_034962901.2 alpha-1,3-mannosyl-glycoprotein 2-beta-N-acetylglucosaminyltransferase [Zootoca vivipara]XP_034962902.2 alpha-1,3-mannosyl-glycoprotein 2-beta-N-acetylglucosaminyltransferase [Zootoca 